MAAIPAPLTLPPRVPPDRDFDALRDAAIQVIVADAGDVWTDHNLSDPGITLMEVLTWSLADLHYRTANRTFELAPVELPLWLDRADRAWLGLPQLDDPADLVGLAAIMATKTKLAADAVAPSGLEAARMARLVAPADSRRAAIGALIDQTFGDDNPRTLSWNEAATVVALFRSGLVRRAALDHSDDVAAAFREAHRTVERHSLGAIDEDEVTTETVRVLGYVPALASLWEDEVRSLIRRHRHRMFVERVAGLLPEIASAGAGGGAGSGGSAQTVASLQAALGVGPDEAQAALALHPRPPGALPENWESAEGSTTTWPPHPLQVRTTEPVTDEDYATRARTAAGVRRAWVVPRILPGIAWDGTARTAAAERPGAVTILVEREPKPTAANRDTFLRSVLATVTAGPGEQAEIDDPYDLFPAPGLEVPRRVIGDELGVAILRACPVTLNGVLHVALGVDRTRVIDAALLRVEAFFAAGRAESAAAVRARVDGAAGIEGPWPPAPQPEGGWRPGEAIRLTELVQVLSNDPQVIGVEGVEVRIDDVWLPGPDGGTEIPLDPDCIPILATKQCLQVRLELAADCGRG